MTDDQVNLVVQHLCEQLHLALRLKGSEAHPPNEGYWIRSCLCKNCIADRLAFGGCHDPPRGSRGERRAAVVLNAKRGTEAPRQCLSWVIFDRLSRLSHRLMSVLPRKQTRSGRGESETGSRRWALVMLLVISHIAANAAARGGLRYETC